MGSIRIIHVEDLRQALVHLLGGAGLPCPEQGLRVKQRVGKSGAMRYVVIAMSGAEALVDRTICRAIRRDKTSVSGIWVLSSQHAAELLEYAGTP
jgi:hypothetical protein